MKNTRRKKLQGHSRAACILENIGNRIEDIHLGLSRPGLVVKYNIDGARDYLNRKDKYLQRQALKRLKQRNLIKMQKIAESYQVALTQYGIDEFMRLKILNSKIHTDGTICMVTFDIPESQSTFRKRIRRILANSAFIPLQRSVWISNIDAADILSKLFKSQYSQKWIRVFTAHSH